MAAICLFRQKWNTVCAVSGCVNQWLDPLTAGITEPTLCADQGSGEVTKVRNFTNNRKSFFRSGMLLMGILKWGCDKHNSCLVVQVAASVIQAGVVCCVCILWWKRDRIRKNTRHSGPPIRWIWSLSQSWSERDAQQLSAPSHALELFFSFTRLAASRLNV